MHSLSFYQLHTHTHTHMQPGLDSRAGEAGDRGRFLFFSPSSPPLTTSKDFSGGVKAACLIAALAVSTMFKNRRRGQRGSHFKITTQRGKRGRETTAAGTQRWGKGGRRDVGRERDELDVY